MITIVAIGKKHEDWVEPGIELYEKRLKQPYDCRWVLLPHSSLEGVRAREEESERILSRIKPSDYVVLLDETGQSFDSPGLARFCEESFSSSKQLVFVIGGAYGVNAALQERANITWSLSKLVFPHQLVRLLLIEQLYRVQEIARGGKYHHQ